MPTTKTSRRKPQVLAAVAPAPGELKLSAKEKLIILAYRKVDSVAQEMLEIAAQTWANEPQFCTKARPTLRLVAGGVK